MTAPLMPNMRCPFCKGLIDGYTAVGVRAAPEPGDVSLCIYCNGLLVFDGEPIRVRAPTEPEVADILSDPRLAARLGILGRAISEIIAGKREGPN